MKARKMPRLTAKEIIRILEKKGFKMVRQSGSHKIYRNERNQRVTVPYHNKQILHPKLLKIIIQDAELEL